MRAAPHLALAAALGLTLACSPARPALGGRALAALQAVGMPTTAGEMVREPADVACPGGGHKRTQLETLRARGDSREVRTMTTYAACRVGATTLDGMLFAHLTHTTDKDAGTRIYGNIDGQIALTGDIRGSCQIALTVEAPHGISGSVCGAELAARP